MSGVAVSGFSLSSLIFTPVVPRLTPTLSLILSLSLSLSRWSLAHRPTLTPTPAPNPNPNPDANQVSETRLLLAARRWRYSFTRRAWATLCEGVQERGRLLQALDATARRWLL